jgi:hypothetical protein
MTNQKLNLQLFLSYQRDVHFFIRFMSIFMPITGFSYLQTRDCKSTF